MPEFNNMIPLNMGEPDRLEEYLNSNDEGSVNKFNIIHLFGKEKLETIQHSLSKATGLAFITVDFRGGLLRNRLIFSIFAGKSVVIRMQFNGVNLPMHLVPFRLR